MVASSSHQVSQELVQSPQMWDIPVRLPPLPLGNLSHIQVAGMCAKLQPTFYFAWIPKYWQRQGLKAGIHLPTSSSDCTNNLTSELFYFSNYLYWDNSFEDCLCILIADYLMQNVYVVLEAGIGAQVSPLPGECWRRHIRELCSIFQCTESFHLFSTTLAGRSASPDTRQQLTASWLRHCLWSLENLDGRLGLFLCFLGVFTIGLLQKWRRVWSTFRALHVIGHGHCILCGGLSGTCMAANWVAKT